MAELKTITLSAADLATMPQEELGALLLKATRIQATCVVRRADGSIKYDDPSLAGTYGEEYLDGGSAAVRD